jgi:hypothetical protein
MLHPIVFTSLVAIAVAAYFSTRAKVPFNLLVLRGHHLKTKPLARNDTHAKCVHTRSRDQ